jgi:hypothetical protein
MKAGGGACATLASAFMEGMATGSQADLGRDWLLHHLYSILVEKKDPGPGEVEVIRADVAERARAIGMSVADAQRLTSGIEGALREVKLHAK